MTKNKYVFVNISGQIIPQNLNDHDSGDILVSMLNQNAVILPITCLANDSSQALNIYNDKVAENLDSLMIITKKESLHVK